MAVWSWAHWIGPRSPTLDLYVCGTSHRFSNSFPRGKSLSSSFPRPQFNQRRLHRQPKPVLCLTSSSGFYTTSQLCTGGLALSSGALGAEVKWPRGGGPGGTALISKRQDLTYLGGHPCPELCTHSPGGLAQLPPPQCLGSPTRHRQK